MDHCMHPATFNCQFAIMITG